MRRVTDCIVAFFMWPFWLAAAVIIVVQMIAFHWVDKLLGRSED